MIDSVSQDMQEPSADQACVRLTIKRSKEGLSGARDSCLLSTAKRENSLIGGHLHSELNCSCPVTARESAWPWGIACICATLWVCRKSCTARASPSSPTRAVRWQSHARKFSAFTSWAARKVEYCQVRLHTQAAGAPFQPHLFASIFRNAHARAMPETRPAKKLCRSCLKVSSVLLLTRFEPPESYLERLWQEQARSLQGCPLGPRPRPGYCLAQAGAEGLRWANRAAGRVWQLWVRASTASTEIIS